MIKLWPNQMPDGESKKQKNNKEKNQSKRNGIQIGENSY